MKTYPKTLATLALLSGLAAGYAQTTAKQAAAVQTATAQSSTQEPQTVNAKTQIGRAQV